MASWRPRKNKAGLQLHQLFLVSLVGGRSTLPPETFDKDDMLIRSCQERTRQRLGEFVNRLKMALAALTGV